MKGLPPALKRRKRYIAFRIIAERKFDQRQIVSAVIDSLIKTFGEFGSANTGVWIEHFDGEKGIIRCYNEAIDKVKVALTLINRIGDVRVIPLTLGVSGTIKKCKRYLEV
ncbi:ribonuclease P [Archaeoglobales archaeon]|nr:MAG: ribonuclease P [Archaeoglobales archaeon]RLI79590.1 MAG: ribonuclease P [Archaeoglobales archaeon]